jgi:hypothetical protein
VTEVREHVEQDGIDLKRAATAAVTAALAGALAGAAKAVVDKRSREAEDDSDETRDEPVDEQPEPDEPDEPEDREEPQAEARDEAEEPEEEPDEEPEEESDEERDDGAGQNGQTGASSSDVAKIIARAKEHLEAVIGSEPEAVSGVERGNGNWRVNVEVVQMRRIPESTDILASYGVVLDDDGGLISVQEVRRYRRSQADGER